jgi:hypothetical protein
MNYRILSLRCGEPKRGSRGPVSLAIGVAASLLASVALVLASPLSHSSPVSATGSEFGCDGTSMATFALGDGTSASPYIVTNSAQLAALTLGNTTVHYRQECDLDIAVDYTNWPGIGTDTNAFRGVYDGGGYTISNVTISANSDNNWGLFRFTEDAVIRNLTLSDVVMTGSGSPDKTGSLIGYGLNTSVDSVTVSGFTMTGVDRDAGGLIGYFGVTTGTASISSVSISAEMKDGPSSRVGGVIGHLEANHEGVIARIENVIANVDITARREQVGGVIGRIDYDHPTSKVNLKNIFVGGIVRAGTSTLKGTKVGGLIGHIDSDSGQISISSAEADVSASANYDYVGGLIGHLNLGSGSTVTLSSTVSRGDVEGEDKVGGLIGWLDLGSNSRAVITASSASGDVTGGQFNEAYGGLVGSIEMSTGSEAVIYGSHAFGNVRTLDNRVGGLIGELAGTRGVLKIMKSSAHGVVEGQDFVGGLIGFIRNRHVVRIFDSFATGDVSSSASTSTVGGLIGSQDHLDSSVDPVPVPDAETTIARTYSTGSVTGNGNVGGLIGLASGATVCASFWDLNTSGKTTSAGGSGAVGKSTADMKKLSTFSGAGWSIGNETGDASKIWGINEGTSYPFLILPTESVSGDCEQSGTGGTDTGGGTAVPPPPATESTSSTTVPSTTVPPTSTVPPTTTTVSPVGPSPSAPPPVLINGVVPQLPVGEVLVVEDGQPVTVEVFVENDTELVLQANTFELRLAGDCANGCLIDITDDGREVLTLEEQGLANVNGLGFEPGSLVHVWLFSEPRYLGQLTVNVDGTFTGSVELGDIDVGEHTLQVNGTSRQGSLRSANLGVVVNPSQVPLPGPGVLPATGGERSSLMLWITLMTLALGSAMLRIARRPQPIR